MASLDAPPTTLRLQFQEFWIFGPRVSRVLQFSAEISVLGFIQPIEEVLQLTSIPVTLLRLIVGSHKPSKTLSC